MYQIISSKINIISKTKASVNSKLVSASYLLPNFIVATVEPA